MKINQYKRVQVEAKTLQIHMKVRDSFCASLRDPQGEEISEIYHQYVPSFFPEDGSDYLVLDIDIDTGMITNWVVPTVEQIEEAFNLVLENKNENHT